jgi:hypothetical protein
VLALPTHGAASVKFCEGRVTREQSRPALRWFGIFVVPWRFDGRAYRKRQPVGFRLGDGFEALIVEGQMTVESSEGLLAAYDEALHNGRFWTAYAILAVGIALDYFDFMIVGFLIAVVGPRCT